MFEASGFRGIGFRSVGFQVNSNHMNIDKQTHVSAIILGTITITKSFG